MRSLICFLTFIFAVGMAACPADDETVIEKVIEKEIQCSDGETIVTDPADCPAIERPPVTPPPPPPPEPDEPEEPAADSGDCNLVVDTKAQFLGSSNDDVICGNDDANNILAGGGDDIVRAGGGDDEVNGGSGNDELYGEDGNDKLIGGEDEDILDGGPGDDTLIGNEGRDELRGGPGSDTVEYDSGIRIVAVLSPDRDINLADGYSEDEYSDVDEYFDIENVKITGSGENTITGDDGPNILTGGTGNDTINGGGGNDTIDGGGGTNELDGGEGIDTLIVGESTTGPLGDNFENLRVRTGTDATATVNLQGNDGPNVLTGHDGPNTLTGNGGNDTLIGGGGDDNLNAGTGRSTLTGGLGNDCFSVSVDDMPDTVTDFTTGDSIMVVGDLPEATQDTNDAKIVTTNVALAAQSGKVVALETYTYDPDGDTGTTDDQQERTKVLATYANVRGLPTDTTIDTGACS